MEQVRELKNFEAEAEEETSSLGALLAGANGFESDDASELSASESTPIEEPIPSAPVGVYPGMLNEEVSGGEEDDSDSTSMEGVEDGAEEGAYDADGTDEDGEEYGDDEDGGEYGDDEEESEEFSHPIDAPIFTFVDVDSAQPFAPEWSVAMPTTAYIGDTQMLLKYLYEVERRNRLSIPIRACGVDAIALEQAKANGIKSTGGKIVFPIDVGEGNTAPTYEVLDIKGELYLSCVSEAVNPEYLSSIIMEATTAIKNNGSYVFEICGYRKLAGEANSVSTLIYTLKLNTYEMSYLCSYMDKENISTTYYPDRIVFEAL